uniref:Fatty acid 2-hydroxylase n=1 Tax=Panagrellus redivivus TaxID=6233 RepID=A0A7E4VWM7_PANRE
MPPTFLSTEERPLFVSYKGKLYNIRAFADKHPGGRKVLERVAGGDIDVFMHGDQRIMGVKHAHSDAAFDMLERYSMDQNFKKDKLVDSGLPVMFEVGHLKEDYWRWIHEPYDGRLRLFTSDFLERLTNTKWWAVPLIWLPLVIFFGIHGIGHMYHDYGFKLGLLISSVLFSLGTLAWTLLEYMLHREVFHWRPDPKSYTQITIHFALHGLHHKTPMDSERLVFPPTLAALIIGFFYSIYISIFPYPVFCLFAGGKLFGYICYDVIHFYLHHGRPRPTTNLHFRKVYHHNHHFKDFDAGYGISTSLWDYVFDTEGSGPL